MWLGTKLTAQLAVVGAGLVVAALHGGGGGPTADPTVTASAYTPPPASAPAPAAHPRIWTAAAHRRPATKAPARRRPAAVRHVPQPAGAAATAKPRATTRRATTQRTTTARTVRTATPRPTYRTALMAAVARIPTYRAGAARWVVSRAYDYWGTADWYHDVLYVSPDVPRSRLYDVAVHEWSHELSVLDYSGDVAAATRAMNAWFGGSGLTGAERAADCMAILQGATWTHYTTCTNTHWRSGAKRLVGGHPL